MERKDPNEEHEAGEDDAAACVVRMFEGQAHLIPLYMFTVTDRDRQTVEKSRIHFAKGEFVNVV